MVSLYVSSCSLFLLSYCNAQCAYNGENKKKWRRLFTKSEIIATSINWWENAHSSKQFGTHHYNYYLSKRFLIYRPNSSGNIYNSMLCSELDNAECIFLWKSGYKKFFSSFYTEKPITYLHSSSSSRICYNEEWLETFNAIWHHGKLFGRFCRRIVLQWIRATCTSYCIRADFMNEKGKINAPFIDNTNEIKYHTNTNSSECARWIKCWNGGVSLKRGTNGAELVIFRAYSSSF